MAPIEGYGPVELVQHFSNPLYRVLQSAYGCEDVENPGRKPGVKPVHGGLRGFEYTCA